MVCCVLTAALLAFLGRGVRRLTGRAGREPVGNRPPPPVRVRVTAPEVAPRVLADA